MMAKKSRDSTTDGGFLRTRVPPSSGTRVLTVKELPRMEDAMSVGHLQLRVLTFEDGEELHQLIFSDPATHTIGNGPFTELAQTREWLARREIRRERHGVTWYAARTSDGTLIGITGLSFGRTGTEPEFGFEIRHDFQGQGHGSSLAAAVVAEAHCAGFARVWATVRPRNAASLRALDRVGFVRDRMEPDDRGDLIYLWHEIS